MNNEIIKNATVITPAITWFSVKLEAKIPNDNAAKLINTKPNIDTKVVTILGLPKYITIKKNINDISNVITITSNAENNFPRTTLNIPVGDVKSNCSVPFFLSSENVLIVNIGTIIIKPYNAV